jgi:hypothetical protein
MAAHRFLMNYRGSPIMNVRTCLCISFAAALCATPAAAQSLRCSGNLVGEGDSKLLVLYRCGPPILRDSYCAPVVYSQTLNFLPEPFATTLVPCQPVEDWLYERGPGNLLATVRLRGGVVRSIEYGRTPQQ